jgi:indole-3-glycerol phosphate synthase
MKDLVRRGDKSVLRTILSILLILSKSFRSMSAYGSQLSKMHTILDKIVATKRGEIERAKGAISEKELKGQLAGAPAVRDFFAALAAEGPIRLIAEVKKASPSAGVIRADFDPVAIAKTYAAHGAACISVLTDEEYFQGRLEYLTQIRAAVSVPVLRKDFILDTYQLVEARVAGADAVLLIAECLDDCNLRKLFNETIELGMTPLVELYEPENLSRVLEAGATLVGVNNRNLHTFEVDLEHSIRMRREVPEDCVLVAESGIKTHADVERLESAGVNAILVGESLTREADIGAAVDRLLGRN